MNPLPWDVSDERMDPTRENVHLPDKMMVWDDSTQDRKCKPTANIPCSEIGPENGGLQRANGVVNFTNGRRYEKMIESSCNLHQAHV